MKKIQKLAGSISWIFHLGRTLSIVSIIAGVISLVGIWGWYLMDHTVLMNSAVLSLGSITIRIAPEYLPDPESAVYLDTATILFSIAACVIDYFRFHSICGILDPLEEGRPFHHETVIHTRRLGWLTVISGITAIAANAVLYFFEFRAYNIGELFISEKITHVTTNIQMEFDFIIYAVVLFLLSYIFKHGEQLQQLSDETL